MASTTPRSKNDNVDSIQSLKQARKELENGSDQQDKDASEHSAMMSPDHSSLLVQAQITKYICDIAERNYRHHDEEAKKWSVDVGMSESTRKMMGRLSAMNSREDSVQAQEYEIKQANQWRREFKTTFKRLKKLSAKAAGEYEETMSVESSSEEESEDEEA